MVGSAVVQEAMSRVSSFVWCKRQEKANQQQSIERLEMAISELEMALERSAKLPITDVSLLRRRKVFEQAYMEGADLLNKHKWPELEGQEASSQASTDCAGKFVRDVESGCSIRHYTFCNPLVRHLLDGRGVEARLQYRYEDRGTAEKRSTQEYNSHGSTDEEDRSATRDWPHLELAAVVMPHLVQVGLQESCAYEVTGFREQRRDGSLQQLTEMVRSEAIGRFICQPELQDYGMLWISAHGMAYYGVNKLSSEIAGVTTAYGRSETRRAAMRKRRNLR
ncbi:hypothetical protein ACP4OV_006930 [Aristida adscensionis]